MLPAQPRETPAPQPAQDERDDLEALGAALSALGGKTILVTGDDRLPCLHVLNPLAPAVSKHIYAQPGFFWWPPAQPIGPRTDIPAIATLIARALSISPSRTADRTPGRNPAA